MRIKLKGSRKTKAIILGICTVIAIMVIIYEGIERNKESKALEQRIEMMNEK